MIETIFKGPKKKIAIMAALLALACFLTYYFHAVLEVGTVFSHFFYIPIILASLWWKRKGLFVAIFLAVGLLLSHIILRLDVLTANDYFRAVMFVVVSFVVVMLSEQTAKAGEALRESEERRKHLNLVLRAIRGVNQLIVRENDRDRLLKALCENLTETRGYHNVWCALLDKSGGLITTAESGLSEDFLPMVERLKRGELTDCGRRALTQSDVVVTEDPFSTCTDCPLAHKYSGSSAITIRLKHGRKVYGLLSVSIPSHLVEEKEERSLFKEVAEDIAFALHNLELEEKRKQAEETLRESEQRFRSIFDNARDGMLLADSKTQKQYTGNKTICQMLGYSLEEIENLSVADIHPEEALPYVTEQFEKQARGEITLAKDIPVKRKDGSVFYADVNSAPIVLGGRTYLMGIFRDITERKQMEEQLIVTDRLASVGELASGIAHELNNPLTGVIGFSQLLLDKELPDDVKEDLRIIYSEAQRAAQVVKGLLAFARKHAPVKQPVNINTIIEKVLEIRAYEQKVSNIRVNTQFAPALPEVMADYFQLQQVFLNIIINAEHFMIAAHGKGTLTITTEKVGDIIRASFTDDGPGIPMENLGHLFDPFFTTKEVGKSTGLGLSICHGIITEHGGQIYADGELGKGATFVVELPITDH